MKTKCKTSTCLALIFFSLAMNAQTQTPAMKEYVLLFHYPNITYTPQHLETLKQQWVTILSSWKQRGAYVSGQVMVPQGTIITADGTVDETAFAKSSTFIGATATVLASAKEEAIAMAKETPVLSVGGQVEIREPRHANTGNQVVLIDVFSVPQEAREAFLERVSISRKMLKVMPGFVEDYAYEKTGGDGRLNYVTVATWENEEAINNAKDIVRTHYAKEGFNLHEFLKRHNIIMERAIYRKMMP